MLPSCSPSDTCRQILSLCADIHRLLGQHLKGDCYKWMLFSGLKESGITYEPCGTKRSSDLFSDSILVAQPAQEALYVVLRTELSGIDQLAESYPSGLPGPYDSLIVNFGKKDFEYKFLYG